MADMLRGHPINRDEAGAWRYSDTGEPAVGNPRPCGACGLPNTPDDHDGCIGEIPGLMNACCGHGRISDAYVQLPSGEVVSGRTLLSLTWLRRP